MRAPLLTAIVSLAANTENTARTANAQDAARATDAENRTRKFARWELEAREGRQVRLLELARGKNELLERYAAMIPEALDDLAPEERHRVYKLLKLRVKLHEDGAPEVSGVFCDRPAVCKTETLP